MKQDFNCDHTLNLRAMDMSEMKDPNETTRESEEIQKSNADQENQEILEFLHWNAEFVKMRKGLLTKATWSMESLTELMQFYIRNMRSGVTECDSKPSQASKLKDSITETLTLFLYIYRNISGARNEAAYLTAMSDLLALYLDMELKTSKRSMEGSEAISARITSTFYVYLEHSVEHWLDALIKVQFMYPCYQDILDPVISRIFKSIPRRPESSIMYTRYFLVYCLWRRINVEKMIKHQITAMTASSLGSLPSTFPPYILRNILPKVPNPQPNTAAALMDYKFDLRKCCEIFIRNSESCLKNLNRANKESHDTSEHSNKHLLQILKPEDRSTINGEHVKNTSAFKHKLNKSEKSLHSANAFNVDAQSSFKCANSFIAVSAKHSNIRSSKLRKHISRRKRKNHSNIVIIDLTSDVALEKCIKKRNCRKIAWLDEAKKRICIRMLKPMKKVAREHNPLHLSLLRKNSKTSSQDQSSVTINLGNNSSTEEHVSNGILNDGTKDVIYTVDTSITNKSSAVGVLHVKEKESLDSSSEELCKLETSKVEASQKLESLEHPCNLTNNTSSNDGVPIDIDHQNANSAPRNYQSAEKSNVIQRAVEIKSPEESGRTQVANDFKQPNLINVCYPVRFGDIGAKNVNTVISRTSSFATIDQKYASGNGISASIEDCNTSNKIIDNNEFVLSTNHLEDRSLYEKETAYTGRNKQMYSCTKETQSQDFAVKECPAFAKHEELSSGESHLKSKGDVIFGKAEKSSGGNAKLNCNAKDTLPQSYFINKSKLSRKAKETAYSQTEGNKTENKLLDSDVTNSNFMTFGEQSLSVANNFAYCDVNSPSVQQCYNDKSHSCDYAKDLRNKGKTVDAEDTSKNNSVLQNMEIREDIDGLSLLASVSQQVPHLSPLRESNRNHLTRNDYASVHKASCNLITESETNVSYNVTFPAVSDASPNDIINKIVGTQSGNVFGKVAVQLEMRSSSDPVIVENSEYGSRGSILHCPDTCMNYDGENLSHIPLSETSINTVKDNTNVILNGETVVLLQKSPNSNLYIINKAVENVKDASNDDEPAKLKEKNWLNHHDVGQLDLNTVDPLFYESELIHTNKVYSYHEDKLLLGQNRSIKVEPDEISLSNMGELKASVQKTSLVNDVSPIQQQAHTLDVSTLNLNMPAEKRKLSKSKLVFRQNIKQEFSDMPNHIPDSNAQGYTDLHPHRSEIDLQHSHVSVTHSMSTLPPIYGNYSGNTESCVLCHKHCATVSCNLQINTSASLYAHKKNSNNSCTRTHCTCLNCGYDIVARCRKCISVHSATDSHSSCVDSNPYFISTHSSVQTPTVQEHDNSKEDSVLGKFYDDPVYCKVEKNFFRKNSADQLGKQCEAMSVSERKIDHKLPLKKRLKAHTMMAMVYKEIQIKSENTTECSLVPASSTNTYSVTNNVHYEGNKIHIPPENDKSSLANKEETPLDFTYFNRSSLETELETDTLPSHQTCQLQNESRDRQGRSINDLCSATAHMENIVAIASERKRIYQESPCKKLKKTQSQLKQTRSSKRNVPKVNYCYTDVDPEWSPSGESKRKRKKANR